MICRMVLVQAGSGSTTAAPALPGLVASDRGWHRTNVFALPTQIEAARPGMPVLVDSSDPIGAEPLFNQMVPLGARYEGTELWLIEPCFEKTLSSHRLSPPPRFGEPSRRNMSLGVERCRRRAAGWISVAVTVQSRHS